MEILISFCNTQIPGLPALALFNPGTSQVRLPRLFLEPGPVAGVTGLAKSAHYLFVAIQKSYLGPPELLILNYQDLKLLNRYVFPSLADLHSLWASENRVYVVSTGTDEIIQLEMRGHEVLSESVFWRPEPQAPRSDNHHLNALYE